MNKETFKVFAIQLGIFAVYSVTAQYLVRSLYLTEFAGANMYMLMAHWLVLLVLMIVNFTNKQSAKAIGYLLSFLIILIVGFGLCASLIFFQGPPGMSQEQFEAFRATTDSIYKADSIYYDSINKVNLRMDSLARVQDSILK